MKKNIFNFNFPNFSKIQLFDETGLESHTIKSLKLVIFSVAFGTICFNITGGVAMTGYLKTLGASDFTFGLIYAIGPLASPLQLLASYTLERTRKRKFIFLTFGIIQRMSMLPFGLVPFFVPMSQPVLRIWMASLFLMISAVSNPFMNVSFYSLAADLVPMDIRGSYFAVRSRVSTMFGVAGGILTAWFLDSFTGFNSYAFVFTLAAAMGTLDALLFIGVKFPPMADSSKQSEKFTRMMSKVVKNKPYIKFILFMTFWMFSVNISGPFYLVYLRNIIGLSNTVITVLMQILPSLCSIIMVKRWGRAIDSHGNKTIMQIANGILSVVPFLWIFVTNNSAAVFMIAGILFMQGSLFAGFEIGANNIMIGHAPKENRSMYIAVYFMTTLIIGTGAANAIGGWLLDNVFSVLESMEFIILGVKMTRYNYIFALTAVLRCFMIYIALPRMIHEENNTPVREVFVNSAARIKESLKKLKKS